MLEPHNTASIARQRMESLWNARWDEHVAESHIRQLGQMLGDVSEELADTPLQLFLLYNRLVRARLEIDIYSEILYR